MSASDPRMHILQMIEDGKISAAEGLRLLGALSRDAAAAGPAPEPAAPPRDRDAPPDPAWSGWRRWWLIPMGAGIGITLIGGLLLYWAYAAAGLSLWLACAALPFGLGVLSMAVAASLRSAKWIHVRVDTGRDEWPRRIALSFPLPIGLTAWFLRTFGPHIPALKKTGVDEVIMALGEGTTPDNPLYVEVDEGRDGEKVKVYIG